MTYFRHSALVAALFLASCQTTDLSGTRVDMDEVQQASVEAPLINRTEVVAVVSSNDSAIELEQKAEQWGYSLIRKESLDGLGLFVMTFDCPPGVDPHVASRELERLTPQANVGANHLYRLQTSDLRSSFRPRTYANELINWPEEGCPADVRIGMLDGYVDQTDMGLSEASIVTRRFVPETEAGEMASDHGTSVAHLLAGPGRLNGATLYSAIVVGVDEEGEPFSGVSSMLKALDWMVESDVDVINISLAGPYNRALDRGIQQAIDKQIVIVAAVGNDGEGSVPQFPAALDGVIGATAVDANQIIYEKAVRGSHVDVAAPGVDVWVGDAQSGRYVTGTSIAAPFVAALIAANPDLINKSDIRGIEKRLETVVRDLGDEGPDPVYGLGLVNAMRVCAT